jgi:transcription antitermination protein NusB
LTEPPLLNRRFIRLQAVQRLYAFYVCKKANHAWALDQIRDHCLPDVFADPPISKDQLDQEAQQAVAMFVTSTASLLPFYAFPDLPSNRVGATVARALASYQHELAKDTRRLEKGLQEAVLKINQACIRIWQLLVEWAHIAKKQAERPESSQQYTPFVSAWLSRSHVLQRLQSDEVLTKLVQREAVGWREHLPLVVGWYNQLVKQELAVQCQIAPPMTPTQDQQLLKLLLEDIILGEETVQSFFSDLDLQWSTHKRIVKKVVRQGLSHCIKDSGKSCSASLLDLSVHWEQEQCFYADLIHRTLQKDEELEDLIAQKSENWALNRIMLLDKTIIKLALCEMIHFPHIPIKVSINEYIALSKIYSMPQSSQFINGLLDAVAATLSTQEVGTEA